MALERITGLEPVTACLEGRNSSHLSYIRIWSTVQDSNLRIRSRAATTDINLSSNGA